MWLFFFGGITLYAIGFFHGSVTALSGKKPPIVPPQPVVPLESLSQDESVSSSAPPPPPAYNDIVGAPHFSVTPSAPTWEDISPLGDDDDDNPFE